MVQGKEIMAELWIPRCTACQSTNMNVMPQLVPPKLVSDYPLVKVCCANCGAIAFLNHVKWVKLWCCNKFGSTNLVALTRHSRKRCLSVRSSCMSLCKVVWLPYGRLCHQKTRWKCVTFMCMVQAIQSSQQIRMSERRLTYLSFGIYLR